jgi:hypothetical protein
MVVQLILLKKEPVVVVVDAVEPITDEVDLVDVEPKTFEIGFVIVGFTEEELFIIIKINILNFYYTT